MKSGSLVHFPASNSYTVLDAWPLMEWLKRKEPATTLFRNMLASAGRFEIKLAMSTINVGEVFYGAWKELGEAQAKDFLRDFEKLPIRRYHPNANEVMVAARLKALLKISYADAFVAVLASELGAPILTGDQDFRLLEAAGIVTLAWCGA